MNEYFQTGAVPAPSSPGASSVMRQEFANIAAGFDKLPVLAGHANEILFVDPTGSRLETNGTVLSELATLVGTQILTNKTLAWADNTFDGFGNAATKVAGTGAGEVLLLAEANKLPALDGSLLTNLNVNQAGTIVDIAHGGTGASTLGGAQTSLGIDLKANASNAALTGVPTAPTATIGTNTTQLATTAFVADGLALKANANNAVLTGAPTAPTPNTGDVSARIATTYFVADTMQAIGAFGPSSMNPLMNGIASAGVAVLGSRSDHVHPSDTSRVLKTGDTMTGDLNISIAGEGGQIALVEPTSGKIGYIDMYAGLSQMRIFHEMAGTGMKQWSFEDDGTLTVSSPQSSKANGLTRKDYVDTYAIAPLALKAPLASPTFTGTPAAPTPATSDNTTKVATTAFVQSLLAQQPPAGMQPSNSTPLMNGTAAAGTGVEGSRYDHVHASDTGKLNISGGDLYGRYRIDMNRADRNWNTAQMEVYTRAGSPTDFSSIALHVQDSTNAPQVGHDGPAQKVGFFSADGTFIAGVDLATNSFSQLGVQGTAANDLTRKDYVDTKLALAGGTLTGNLVVPSLNGGPLAGFRNRLINGDMRIAQRPAHTPLLATIDFLADRWFSWSEGAANASITLVATPTGGVDGNRNYLSIMGAAGNTYSSIWQRIEAVNCADLKNKVITVSAEVYTQDARAVSFDLRYPNARDNWSAMTTIGTWSSPVASGWRRIQTQFTVPNNTFGLSVGVSFGALGAGVEALITAVQIEEGAVATPFEQRLISVEMQLCFRYYWRIQANSTYSRIIATGTTNGNGTGGYFVFRTPVKMRGICAVTMSIIGNFHIGSGASSFNATSFTLDSTSLNNPELDSFVLHVLHAGAAFLVGGACMLLTLGSQSSNHIGFNSELL